MSDNAPDDRVPQAATPAPSGGGIHLSYAQLLLAGVLCALLGLLGRAGYSALRYEQTDDATVEGRHTLLAPKVAGVVLEVLFDDNEEVQAGQPLVRIDPRDYSHILGVHRAELQAAQAELKDATLKYHESVALEKTGAINTQRKDTDEARYGRCLAEVQRLQQRVEQDKVDLDYSTLRAPQNGKVGRRTVEPGMYAHTGQALVSFVTAKERFVVANFKETQLRRMQLGSRAEIRVDAVADRVFTGVVESMSPSSGAIFSLLPPDNATGNYIKIVQRVPVKLALENLNEGDDALLQVGLNADVRILLP